MDERVEKGLACEHAGHSWQEAGGGLEICALCESERWETNDENPSVAETCLTDRAMNPGAYGDA